MIVPVKQSTEGCDCGNGISPVGIVRTNAEPTEKCQSPANGIRTKLSTTWSPVLQSLTSGTTTPSATISLKKVFVVSLAWCISHVESVF